jgi:hypothetical protein
MSKDKNRLKVQILNEGCIHYGVMLMSKYTGIRVGVATHISKMKMLYLLKVGPLFVVVTHLSPNIPLFSLLPCKTTIIQYMTGDLERRRGF